MTFSTTDRKVIHRAIQHAAAETTFALSQVSAGSDAADRLHRLASALEAHAAEAQALAAVDLGSGSARLRRPSRLAAGMLAVGVLATPGLSVTSSAVAAKRPVVALPPSPGGESDDDADVTPPGPPAEDTGPPAQPEPPPPTPEPTPQPVAPPAAPPVQAPPPAAVSSPDETPTPATTSAPSDEPAVPEEVAALGPTASPEPPPPTSGPPPVTPPAGPPQVVTGQAPQEEDTVHDLPHVEELAIEDTRASAGRPPTQPMESSSPDVADGTRAATNRVMAGGGVGAAAIYIVTPGDTLWSIAREAAGPRATATSIALLVGAIWQRNAERIGTGDPDVLPVGVRLFLPSNRIPHA